MTVIITTMKGGEGLMRVNPFLQEEKFVIIICYSYKIVDNFDVIT